MAAASYDYLILGSGISGMGMAVCLASAGAKVLILEKSRVPGGAMQRFRRKGIPLDTGFHFTGGIPGCFEDMLSLAGIRSELEPVPISMRICFMQSGKEYRLPRGHRNAEGYLAERFPADAEKIHRYFALEREIIDKTPLFDLRKTLLDAVPLPENAETTTLSQILDRFSFQGELRAVLEGSATCHGTPPDEISFAGHCRVNYGLMNELCRIRGGGDAVVQACLRRMKETHAELRTGCTVQQFGPMEGPQCHSAILTDGKEVSFDRCVMTLHPREILRLLPADRVRPLFREQVESYEETCGFFTVHLKISSDAAGFQEELTSCLNTTDMNDAILVRSNAWATGMMLSEETASDGAPCRCLTAFRSVVPEETAEWSGSVTGGRPAAYYAYKEKKYQEILSDILRVYPAFEGKAELLATSSMLTFRDYLSPFGSAYGIRQKTGQRNLFGHLPVRNFFVCGQNSMLPGAFGSLLSSCYLFRHLAGESAYQNLLSERMGETV